MNTTSPTSRYAKFLSQFPFGVEKPQQDVGGGTRPERVSNVRWTGNVGYVELGSVCGCLARIELVRADTTFGRFRVDIISRVNGKLDSLTFEFNDILDPKDRVDNRPEMNGFHAWSSSVPGSGSTGTKDLDWYIAKPSPKSIKHFVATVNEYLAMWQGSHLFGTR